MFERKHHQQRDEHIQQYDPRQQQVRAAVGDVEHGPDVAELVFLVLLAGGDDLAEPDDEVGEVGEQAASPGDADDGHGEGEALPAAVVAGAEPGFEFVELQDECEGEEDAEPGQFEHFGVHEGLEGKEEAAEPGPDHGGCWGALCVDEMGRRWCGVFC